MIHQHAFNIKQHLVNPRFETKAVLADLVLYFKVPAESWLLNGPAIKIQTLEFD